MLKIQVVSSVTVLLAGVAQCGSRGFSVCKRLPVVVGNFAKREMPPRKGKRVSVDQRRQ